MWKEVTRAKAKSIFMNYGKVYALPSKVRVDNDWMKPVLIDTESFNGFDEFCNCFKFYNANSECGRGIRFYVNT